MHYTARLIYIRTTWATFNAVRNVSVDALVRLASSASNFIRSVRRLKLLR